MHERVGKSAGDATSNETIVWISLVAFVNAHEHDS